MITGVHTMFYTSNAEDTRRFLRDKLGFPFTDVGGGWLIFDLPDAEMGCHPSDETHPAGRAGTHSISFYCDNINQTVADLKSKGVEFTCPVKDQGYGLVTSFKMPGGIEVDLYQPHYRRNSTKPGAPPHKKASRPRSAARGKASKVKAAKPSRAR
jgi:catechol 2,3-dioxygenase-like lactoylglutathione lyase family enzyme